MEFHQLQILYGTDKTSENTTEKVLAAVKVGYRAIDTANGYGQYTPGPIQFFLRKSKSVQL